MTAASDTDTSNVLENNQVVDNDVYTCAAGSLTGEGGRSTAASRMNRFDRNRYRVPDSTST